MENSTLRALEGMRVALCAVLPPEGVQAVNNALATFADHPKTPLATAIAYRQLIFASEPLEAEPEIAPPMGILGAFPETVTRTRSIVPPRG